jgi:DNA-binding transcriptional LysR family regulator
MNLLAALRMFRMVAEGRNLSEAGRQSGQTASTVSRQMQALEAHLGVRLMQRTTREVQLTALGAESLERVAPILDDSTPRIKCWRDNRRFRAGSSA